jgi:hypothetical protein
MFMNKKDVDDYDDFEDSDDGDEDRSIVAH